MSSVAVTMPSAGRTDRAVASLLSRGSAASLPRRSRVVPAARPRRLGPIAPPGIRRLDIGGGEHRQGDGRGREEERVGLRSEEHPSALQARQYIVYRFLLAKNTSS